MWLRLTWRDVPALFWESIKGSFRRPPSPRRDPLDPGGPDGSRPEVYHDGSTGIAPIPERPRGYALPRHCPTCTCGQQR